MTIEYDFFKTHGALADKNSYHVRPVDRETVDTDTMLERIQQGTTLTIPDLKGAVSALSHEITTHLKEGRKVYLEGLGYFSLSIDGEVVTDKNDKLRLKNPRVRTIHFQPEEQMMKQMGQVSFSCKGHRGNHSQPMDADKAIEVIQGLMKDKSFFTAGEFQTAAKVTHTTSYRILKALVAEKKIKNIGTPARQLFTQVSQSE